MLRLTRDEALPYVAYTVDDSLNARQSGDPFWVVPSHARLVGWQCGFEPLFVAVFSYLPNVRLTAEDAEEIAADYLDEIEWLSDGPTPADFIII